MEEILKQLGITKEGTYSRNGNYVVTLDNSDEWNRYYARLGSADGVEEVSDSSQLTLHDGVVNYRYEDVQISLIANFETDEYKLTATKY